MTLIAVLVHGLCIGCEGPSWLSGHVLSLGRDMIVIEMTTKDGKVCLNTA